MELSNTTLWLLAGGALIGMEALLLPGIGFLFAGLGALTVGVALMAGWIEGETAQLTWFFTGTALWAAALWFPLKSLYHNKGAGYSDMIGSHATVGRDGLTKKKKGAVQWSGTTMNARLDSECRADAVDAGSEVIIKSINEGVLIVTPEKKEEE